MADITNVQRFLQTTAWKNRERLLKMIVVKGWDHTQPFPESLKSGDPYIDAEGKEIWEGGAQLYAEQLRAAEEIRYAQTGKKNDVSIQM